MRGKKALVGIGAFFVVACCGGGSLLLTFVGRTMADKARTICTTTDQLRGLGMKPDPAELEVKVPPNEDARVLLNEAIKLITLYSRRDPARSPAYSAPVVAGYASQAEIKRMEDAFGNFEKARAVALRASRFTKISSPNIVKAKSGMPTVVPDITPVVQMLSAHAIFSARRSGLAEAAVDLDAAARIMRLGLSQPIFGPAYQRLYQEIIILRGAEQCARAVGRGPATADFLEKVGRDCEEGFNLRTSLAGQVAIDSMLIDNKENKVWRDIPFGENVKTLYQATIAEHWLKFYPQFPESLEDVDEAETVFKAMADAASKNVVIQNGASNLTYIVPMARDLLARRRLLRAAVDALRGKPINEIDPYSGKPLKTISRDGMDIIYSFARDRKDDQGHPRGRGPSYPARFDLIYVLPRM